MCAYRVDTEEQAEKLKDVIADAIEGEVGAPSGSTTYNGAVVTFAPHTAATLSFRRDLSRFNLQEAVG
jgi:hypothetical protein